MSDTIEQFGDTRVFGQTAIVVNAITGFLITEVTIDAEPEFFQTGTDGQGLTGAVSKPAPSQDMLALKLKGYVLNLTSFNTLADSFSATIAGVSRFFIIKKKSQPFKEKDFLIADVDAVSYINVTSESI